MPQPPKRKRSGIGVKWKKSRLSADDRQAYADATAAERAAATAEDTGAERVSSTSRTGDNWRVDRAVKSRQKKIDRLVIKTKSLNKDKITLQKKVVALNEDLKQSNHQIHQEKKAHRAIMDLSFEERHNALEEAIKERDKYNFKYLVLEEKMEDVNNKAVAQHLDLEDDMMEVKKKAKAMVHHERGINATKIDEIKSKSAAKVAAVTNTYQEQIKQQDVTISNMEQEHEAYSIDMNEKVGALHERLDGAAAELHDEKKKRREFVVAAATNRKSLESETRQKLRDMEEWMDEWADEVKDSKREAKKALKAKGKVDELAKKRLDIMKNLKTELNAARDELVEESKKVQALERINNIGIQIKKERVIGRRGGGKRWPVRVVLLICELLVGGTPPSAIPDNIQTSSITFTGHGVADRPCINFVRQCRVVLQILNETLSAYKLGKAERYYQGFTDGTSKKQIAFQNLVVSVMGDDNKIVPIILSSCIILEDESSDTNLRNIIDQFDSLKQRMKRWREIVEREFPNRPDLLEFLPMPDDVDLAKIHNNGCITTDTCNGAKRLQRIFVEYVKEIAPEGTEGHVRVMDCMQHVRNVIIKGAAKAVSSFLSTFLQDNLEEISSWLRVSPDLANVIYAYHKEFSLTANYPKGHGELFREWVKKNYPREYLLHAERASGGRQDTICLGAGPIYMNRPVNTHFLDDMLSTAGNDNILQENLFIILSSVEMIATSRFFGILHVAFCIPHRYLAGSTHKLAHRNWGPMSMGRVFDILYDRFHDILDDLDLIHDKTFMMGMFDELKSEVKEFDDYLNELFTKKDWFKNWSNIGLDPLL